MISLIPTCMVNLDSPLLTLGALFVAGQDSRGRKFTGGESGKGLIAGGFGGASADWAGSQLQNLTGGNSALTDELAQALAGAAISRFGDPIPQNNAIARGIHYNVAAQAATQAGLEAGSLFGGFMDGGTQSAPSPPTNQTAPPEQIHVNRSSNGATGGKVY